MTEEMVLKLLVDMGPEGSSAFMYWIVLQAFSSILTTAGLVALIYTIYRIAYMLINADGAIDVLRDIRKLTHPTIGGQITKSEIHDSVELIKQWSKNQNAN